MGEKIDKGWLIEIATDEGAKWLQHDFRFKADPHNAIRFSRKSDAEAVMAWGLGGIECVATEHTWSDK